MKGIILFILVSCLPMRVKAQVCSMPYPPENLRADTITAYHFQDTILPVSYFPDARATSNISFQSQYYRFMWLPLKTGNVEAFILRSLAGMPGTTIKGRWKCSILGKEYEVIVLGHKRKLALWFYQPGTGNHFYVADGIRVKNRKAVFQDIKKVLR